MASNSVSQLLQEDDEEVELVDEEDFGDLQIVANCVNCGDDIRLTEEVFLIAFTRPYQTPEGVVFYELTITSVPIPVGVPCFYCFTCWEEQKEALQDNSEDELPIQEDDGKALLECDICSSDICHGETFATETFGELQWSERSPNGQATVAFIPMGDASHICVDCISNAEEDQAFQIQVSEVEDEEPITCQLGKHLRCWRDRSRCICHNET